MSGAGAFLQGFAGGFSSGKDMQRERERMDMWREWNQDRTYMRRGERDGYYRPDTWQQPDRNAPSASTMRDGPRATGPSHIASDPVAVDMPRHQRAFLNAIAVGESGGAYDVRYTPQGGAKFDLNGQHPRVFEPGPHGPSSAAGRYQFTATTWDDTGGGEFSPENQDRRAWGLAVDRYRAQTGRDLDRDLMRNGMTAEMVDALAPTWAAFHGDPDRFIKTYDESFGRYIDKARETSSDPYRQEQAKNPRAEGVLEAAKQQSLPPLSETGGVIPKERGIDPLFILQSQMGGV